MVMAAADIAGVDRVFTIGGAQAVAALAYGTETIPQVDKIVGPGNIYVATAKGMVFGAVGIDMIAGPTDSLILADATSDAHVVATDLVSQADALLIRLNGPSRRDVFSTVSLVVVIGSVLVEPECGRAPRDRYVFV